MKSKILISLFAVLLIAAACNKSSPTTNSNSEQNSSQSSQTQTPLSGKAEVDITANGFSPADITVKQGTVVTFKNLDTAPHWPASNPHPTHTDLPGFDALKNLNPGDTYSFTFDKLGTWGYHDHLNPSRNHGTVTVVQ